ncbi:MAG: PQQ-dependent sugar dehydrogenase [Akkermansiaceae bacterium]
MPINPLRKIMITLSCVVLCLTKVWALDAETLVSGLLRPIAIAQAPGDKDRLFVLERKGVIRVVERKGKVWKINNQPFLTIKGVFTNAVETGALGIAFHPDYKKNRYLFIRYNTDPGPKPDHRQEVLLRVRASERNPNVADPSSLNKILVIPKPWASEHQGGWMEFGPKDGMLYMAVGDNGHHANGQLLSTLCGKILRIDVDGKNLKDGIATYDIPKNNPFQKLDKARPEIYHLGLRNPWRCGFDAVSGDLWIADVGSGPWERPDNAHQAFEEVNIAKQGKAGLNFGWPVFEGKLATSFSKVPHAMLASVPKHTLPITVYARDKMSCITGGYVYRGTHLRLKGAYICADFSGRFYSIKSGRSTELKVTGVEGGIATFGHGNDGALYLCSYSSGILYRLLPGK